MIGRRECRRIKLLSEPMEKQRLWTEWAVEEPSRVGRREEGRHDVDFGGPKGWDESA